MTLRIGSLQRRRHQHRYFRFYFIWAYVTLRIGSLLRRRHQHRHRHRYFRLYFIWAYVTLRIGSLLRRRHQHRHHHRYFRFYFIWAYVTLSIGSLYVIVINIAIIVVIVLVSFIISILPWFFVLLLLFVCEQFGEREKVEENISVHLMVLTFWVFVLNSLTIDKIFYCPYYSLFLLLWQFHFCTAVISKICLHLSGKSAGTCDGVFCCSFDLLYLYL